MYDLLITYLLSICDISDNRPDLLCFGGKEKKTIAFAIIRLHDNFLTTHVLSCRKPKKTVSCTVYTDNLKTPKIRIPFLSYSTLDGYLLGKCYFI